MHRTSRPATQPSRRQVLARGAALTISAPALASCAAPGRGRGGTGPSTVSPSGPVRSAPGAHGAAGAALDLPDRSEIEDRFGNRLPRTWSTHPAGAAVRFSAPPGPRTLALTFDACGGTVLQFDRRLIETLRAHRAKATLFVNQRWAEHHSREFEQLAQDPLFEIGNHGTRHVPLSVSGRSAWGIRGTASAGEVWDEVAGCARFLAEHGLRPRFFRPGTAFADDVAEEIVEALGQRIASFSVNADGGATFPAPAVMAEAVRAPSGSVLIGHMNRPLSGTAEGIEAALSVLSAEGVRFVTMSEAFPED
ncbi:polysaccharide deacetylase family protein [Arthrobacter sp. UM1]|uniref:polysaccharide deacetylase family protein n=1 Tax=Arthrobacter sp. UM1 TaxID=2766776 RepID=UPI001CF6132E|nr:polysaccharide deacetylase family protein [Arthrobacter sp. UM1]MCB4209074.1 polysaccharide deacetylase family protein [Arthrobacter sp. UM1]